MQLQCNLDFEIKINIQNRALDQECVSKPFAFHVLITNKGLVGTSYEEKHTSL